MSLPSKQTQQHLPQTTAPCTLTGTFLHHTPKPILAVVCSLAFVYIRFVPGRCVEQASVSWLCGASDERDVISPFASFCAVAAARRSIRRKWLPTRAAGFMLSLFHNELLCCCLTRPRSTRDDHTTEMLGCASSRGRQKPKKFERTSATNRLKLEREILQSEQ